MPLTHYCIMSCLLAAAGTATAAVLQTPPEPPAAALPVQQVQTGQYQCLNPSSQLHALLKKYALKCGNPGCPVCYPASPSP